MNSHRPYEPLHEFHSNASHSNASGWDGVQLHDVGVNTIPSQPTPSAGSSHGPMYEEVPTYSYDQDLLGHAYELGPPGPTISSDDVQHGGDESTLHTPDEHVLISEKIKDMETVDLDGSYPPQRRFMEFGYVLRLDRSFLHLQLGVVMTLIMTLTAFRIPMALVFPQHYLLSLVHQPIGIPMIVLGPMLHGSIVKLNPNVA